MTSGQYWWNSNPEERYWVEIRKRAGIGLSLWCPSHDEDGGEDPWYELVRTVKAGDVVLHWSAREHRFVGSSRAASDCTVRTSEYEVELEDFQPLHADVGLAALRARAQSIYGVRDRLRQEFGSPLYLPFQFKKDYGQLSLMSNYFAKLPSAYLQVLFDQHPIRSHGEPNIVQLGLVNGSGPVKKSQIRDRPPRSAFLQPFRPKADTHYVVDIDGGQQERSRDHETLVNDCARWLSALGYQPSKNAAVDLGLANPAVVIEAKTGSSWSHLIRAAVGQLYEYRYFQVADPAATLILLTDDEPPTDWLRYLESDRRIGALWRSGAVFAASPIASKTLRDHPAAR